MNNNSKSEKWWHDNMSNLATQLSNGVLSEMKRRIQTSNIKKERLTLNEDTQRMREFFEREIKRYENRKEATRLKQQSSQHIDKYRDIIRTLLKYNQALANKCQQHDIPVEKIRVWSTVYSFN